MYYSVFTPPTDTPTPPSLQFSPMGYLADPEAIALESQLEGSYCQVVVFESKDHFERYIDEKDEEYWRKRDYVRHAIASGLLKEVHIHTN